MFGGGPKKELKKATGDWSKRVLMREYEDNDKGHEQLEEEAAVLAENGYTITSQTQAGHKLRKKKALLTGGVGALFGGIRTGLLKVTYSKQ